MNKSLELAKNELEWLVKQHKANVSHSRNKYQETLKYEIVYNHKKTVLTIRMVFMPKENALTLSYEYSSNKKEVPFSEKHSFSDVLKDQELPAISDADVKRLKDNIRYEKIDNEIKGKISPTTQAVTYTEIIKRSIHDMLNYGRDLGKTDI